MLRFYLSQNKWIDLGLATNGSPGGAPCTTVGASVEALGHEIVRKGDP
jgi:hypothetical protein